jgi:hypothetical protein
VLLQTSQDTDGYPAIADAMTGPVDHGEPPLLRFLKTSLIINP